MLLDVFQTYRFGRALTDALTRWLAAANGAVDVIGRDMRSLQLKEIAYLVQFRLAAEGQGLEEYLEWFFGEALLDYIVRGVDEAHAQKPLENDLEPSAATTIDGGFEPTKFVAGMYHRVRIESKRSRARKNFRLGDLYLDKKKPRVIAVMTPDCDLVLRKSGSKENRNADHLLFVPGQISDLEKTSGSVGDFLMIEDKPHNIQWTYKKVFSAPFTGPFEKAALSGADYQYLGTLRPLYAQEVQAHLLNHVGRVGVAVAPLIGMPAVATIIVRTPSGPKDISAQGTAFNCSLIPARASGQQGRVVFDREVIRKIKAALIAMPLEGLVEDSKAKIEALKQQDGDAVEKALKAGPEVGSELANGIFLTGKRDGSATAPWCAVYVSQVTVAAKQPAGAVMQGTAEATTVSAPMVGLVEPEGLVGAAASQGGLDAKKAGPVGG
jgi:hypothetical protein